MPTHTLERKDSSLPVHPPVVQAQQAQQAFAMPTHAISRKGSPNMPTVGEDSDGSGGATAKAQALYAAPVEAAAGAQAAEPGTAAGSDDAKQDAQPAGCALQPETSSVVLQPEAPAQASAAPSTSPRPPLPGVPSGDGPLGRSHWPGLPLTKPVLPHSVLAMLAWQLLWVVCAVLSCCLWGNDSLLCTCDISHLGTIA